MAAPSFPRFRPRRILFGLVALAFGAAVWYFAVREPANAVDLSRATWEGAEGQRPVPVRTVKVSQQDLPIHLKAIGTVTPLNTVTVRSRVDGQLLRLAFEEGQMVKAGELLAEIDPAPYKIQLDQAEGQFKQDLAQLETARRDLERFEELRSKDLVSKQQFDAQHSLVKQREGTLASDQAAVDDAKLRLSYTRIHAPIAGRLGLRKVDVGNLIRANDANGLVVITQMRPIAAVFTVPEVDLAQVVDPLRAGEPLAVEAWDRSEKKRLATGALKTVDNQIDLATGTLRIKAEFPNGDETLFPNQFVNIRLRVRTLADAIVIPSAAVQFGSRGTYVYVVDARNQAMVRDIVLGPADAMMQAVTKGLQPGDAVVLEGLDRLREGRKVIVTNDTPPAGDS